MPILPSVIRLDPFCATPFWDHGVWKSETLPDLPFCFVHTAMVWLPTIFLLFSSLLVFYDLAKIKKPPLKNGALYRSKKVLTAIAAVDWAIVSVYIILRGGFGGMAWYLYAPVMFLAMIYLLVLTVLRRKPGLHTSGAIFSSWVAFAFCSLPEAKYWLGLAAGQKPIQDKLLFIMFLLYVTIAWVQVILHIFGDPWTAMRELRPEHVGPHQIGRNPSPELNASFLNQLTQWWFTPLVVLGKKRALQPDDVWDARPDCSSKHIVPLWKKFWRGGGHKQTTPDHSAADGGDIELVGSASTEEAPLLGGKQGKSYGASGKSAEQQQQDETMTKELKKSGSIPLTLVKMFWPGMLEAAIMRVISDLSNFAKPIMLSLLIKFTANHSMPLWIGLLYSVVTFLILEIFCSLFLNKYWYNMMKVGTQVQCTLVNAVYGKAMRLSSPAKNARPMGEIVNLMAVDCDRFFVFMPYAHVLWAAPITIAICMIMLNDYIGIAATMAGVSVIIISIPINSLITLFMRRFQVAQMKFKDKRVKLMSEILSGIKAVKLYAWEPSMERMIHELREKEVSQIRKFAIMQAFGNMFWLSTPVLINVAAFAAFLLPDPEHNVLTPQVAFVSAALFNLMRVPLNMFTDVVAMLVQVVVSNKRLTRFLLDEEIDETAIDKDYRSPDNGVVVTDGTFAWEKEQIVPTLSDINVAFPKGKLTAVIGQVGAGKSSLLSAIIGEMEKEHGYVGIDGSMAYVPQQAWIQNMTVKDNILFGRNMDRVFFDKTLDACALKPDLLLLSDGELTEIGEKGINLSGGQKARISLARAVYHDQDIYLLDDPLSAVDAHVAKHIFQQIIGSSGMLLGKTRILVTHGLSFLHLVDQIVVMHDGKIVDAGSYVELETRKGGIFHELVAKLKEEEAMRKQKAQESDSDDDENDELVNDDDEDGHSVKNWEARELGHLSDVLSDTIGNIGRARSRRSSVRKRRRTGGSRSRHASRRGSAEAVKVPTEPMVKLIQAETRQSGTVRWKVYLDYIQAMGYSLAFLALSMFLLRAAIQLFRDVYLSHWANENLAMHETLEIIRNATKYHERVLDLAAEATEGMTVFSVMGISDTVVTGLCYIFAAFGLVNAGRNLHRPLVHNILRQPMAFFDQTPAGRILNRVNKDIDYVDFMIPNSLAGWMFRALKVISTELVIIFSTPLFVLALVPLSALYYFILKFYLATARQIKRIESTTRSPVYSSFGESVQGLSSIRAYGEVNRFIQNNQKKVDKFVSVNYLTMISVRWVGVRLEFIGNCVVLFSALFGVLARDWAGLTAGIIGLSVSYAMNATNVLNMWVQKSSDLETSIVAVERIKEYIERPTEAEWKSEPENKPPGNWPNRGGIEFKQYSTRYREGLELVLNKLTGIVLPSEKIGIVGRTGAGKSSIALALFRIIEGVEGEILIDKKNIAKMGLHDLRENLTIIPQDPVLFSGSLRVNLDPFDQYTDAEVWTAVENAHLKNFVSGLPGKLDYEITEGGENLSVGQKQLVCLARALLRNNKILILDEATAAVDLKIDSLIQETIRDKFSKATVLTVAHRINTILDCDRVIVLDKGRIVEFDTPTKLLANKESIFYSMVQNAKAEGGKSKDQ